MIQDRISDRQTGNSRSNIWHTDRWFEKWFKIEYLTKRWMMQMNILSNIWKINEWCRRYLIRYSLHRSSICQIFDFESFVSLSNIRSWIIYLSVKYSILNHLLVCQIFDFELPACLSNIRFCITCLSVKYSILNHRSVCQIFGFESPVCIENTVLFLPENASRIQCFFALKVQCYFGRILPYLVIIWN